MVSYGLFLFKIKKKLKSLSEEQTRYHSSCSGGIICGLGIICGAVQFKLGFAIQDLVDTIVKRRDSFNKRDQRIAIHAN